MPKQYTHSRRRLVIPSWEKVGFNSYTLGGKGHGITRLVELGLPTPPALVISTSLARSYRETGKLPKRFNDQLERELKNLERKTGEQFGNPGNPLLVSVRSGAMISMPGMMDTVLNVGLTVDVTCGLVDQLGDQFVSDCRRHLKVGLGWSSSELQKSNAHDQLLHAVVQVLKSWQSARAQAYRREHSIDENLGTAVTIQAMVFGNLKAEGESGTGVVMSHNPNTAEPIIFGNYLPNAQGHDLVSGEVTPDPIETFLERQPKLAQILKKALGQLQDEVCGPVEVEFTVENGILYFLQFRKAKLSPLATVIHLVREKHAGRITRDDVVSAVPEWIAEAVSGGVVLRDDVATLEDSVIAKGMGVGQNAVNGVIACTDEIADECQRNGAPYILVRETTNPDDFERMLNAVGIVTQEGGTTCHAAVVARHQGIPAVIGVGEKDFESLRKLGLDRFITLDTKSGVVLMGSHDLVQPAYSNEVCLFNKWRHVSKPVIVSELCLEEFATNTALNNFYMAEAMLVECTDKTLADKIRLVHRRLTEVTGKVFSTYLALAVASEITHAEDRKGKLSASLGVDYEMIKCKFSLEHRNSWYGKVVPKVATELASSTSDVVADFFCVCRRIFSEDVWTGVIGGKKWAEIASVGEQYWRGEIKTVTFIDRVFDLRHNSGSVFNKHPMVSTMYREYALDRQLDIKRQQLSITQKWLALKVCHQELDPDLLAFYEDGQRKGVWK